MDHKTVMYRGEDKEENRKRRFEMNEKIINELFEDVRVIVESNRAENYKNGKDFNVFYVQGVSSDEVRICKLIRELLDPNGSHGQGDVFLRQFFIDVIKLDVNEFSDYQFMNCRVVCEEIIDDLRRIDIVIHIGNRMIPIEVKVYAKDQDKQCMDYYNYAVKTDSNTKLYYLTLDGHEPSKESKGTLKDEQYACISFSEEIINWLDDCIGSEEIEQIYAVREILIQFRKVLRDLTGKHGGKHEMKIKEKIVASKDSVVAAMEIEKALTQAKIDKMREVFFDIKQHMVKMGYTECIDSYYDEARQYYEDRKKSWPSINFQLPIDDISIADKIVLRFEIDERIYFGICPWSGKNNWDRKIEDYIKEYIEKNLMPKGVKFKSTAYWYWWEYLSDNQLVNFKYCNEDYLKLFDEKGYKEHMETLYSKIDQLLAENIIPLVH